MPLFAGDSTENSIASGNLSLGDILALDPKFSFQSCFILNLFNCTGELYHSYIFSQFYPEVYDLTNLDKARTSGRIINLQSFKD